MDDHTDPGNPPAGGNNPPAGWHRDPLSRIAWRYWDGEGWSPHASADGSTIVVDSDESLPPPHEVEPDRHRFAALMSTLVILGVLVLVLFIGAGAGDDAAARNETAGDGRGATSTPSSDSDTSAGGALVDTYGAGAPLDLSGDLQGAESGGAAVDTDGGAAPDPSGSPSALSGERVTLKVVYEVVTNNGDEFERVIATDSDRSILRDEDSVLFTDGIDLIGCFRGGCSSMGPSASHDYLNSVRIGSLDGTADRVIAGREAECNENDTIGWTMCWDTATGILLLNDPGDEAMQPSAFDSERRIATFVGPPKPSDFELPYEVERQDPE